MIEGNEKEIKIRKKNMIVNIIGVSKREKLNDYWKTENRDNW